MIFFSELRKYMSLKSNAKALKNGLTNPITAISRIAENIANIKSIKTFLLKFFGKALKT